jgi:signal transduction histidine kinase
MTRIWWRQLGRRVPAAAVDTGLAATYLAAALLYRTVTVPAIGARMPLAVALSVVIAGGLALRRRAPVAGYLVGSAGMAAEALFVAPNPISPYANLIGIYSLGLYANRRRAWWGPPLVVCGVLGYFAAAGSPSFATPAGVVFSWLLAWALGYSTARRREDQQVAQRLQNRQAITEERARIARELHDLIGHTVNLMLVQTGAARRVLDRDTTQARELLSTVEQTGRDALGELDRVLGILRTDGPVEDEVDGPGLSRLPALVERMGQAGLRVDVETDGAGPDIPPSVSLTAYRIVQEALTNALRHGGASGATVAIRRCGGSLQIEIRDDGRGPAPGYAPGRGLVGMHERVALFGGTAEFGGGEGSGFVVRADLPMP